MSNVEPMQTKPGEPGWPGVKPRLRRVLDADPLSVGQWSCGGGGSYAHGSDPAAAYWYWEYRLTMVWYRNNPVRIDWSHGKVIEGGPIHQFQAYPQTKVERKKFAWWPFGAKT